MILPLNDTEKTRYGDTPMTIMIIFVCAVIWLFQELLLLSDYDKLFYFGVYVLGTSPEQILQQEGFGGLTTLTATFMHSGFAHMFFNMWALWVFGRRVEDACGPWRFLGFYLFCGATCTIAYTLIHAGSPIPAIGASGTINGVMAAYLFLFTGERITTLVLPIPYLFKLPAWAYIVYNFGHDLLLGFLTEEVVKQYGASPFGTDVFAHMGGLVVGLAFVYLYLPPEALIDQRRGR